MIQATSAVSPNQVPGRQPGPPILRYSVGPNKVGEQSRRKVVDLARETYSNRHDIDRLMKEARMNTVSDQRRASARDIRDLRPLTMSDLNKRTSTALARVRRQQMARDNLKTSNSSRTYLRTQTRASPHRDIIETNHMTLLGRNMKNDQQKSNICESSERFDNRNGLHTSDQQQANGASFKHNMSQYIGEKRYKRQSTNNHITDSYLVVRKGNNIVNCSKNIEKIENSSNLGKSNSNIMPDIISKPPENEINYGRQLSGNNVVDTDTKQKRVQFCLQDIPKSDSSFRETLNESVENEANTAITHLNDVGVPVTSKRNSKQQDPITLIHSRNHSSAKKPQTIESALTRFKQILKQIDNKVCPENEATFHFTRNLSNKTTINRHSRPRSTTNNSPTTRMLRRAGVDIKKSEHIDINDTSMVHKLCGYRMPMQSGDSSNSVNKASSKSTTEKCLETAFNSPKSKKRCASFTQKNLEQFTLKLDSDDQEFNITENDGLTRFGKTRVQEWLNEIYTDEKLINSKNDEIRDFLAGLPIIHPQAT